MSSRLAGVAIALAILGAGTAAAAQSNTAERAASRDQLRAVLTSYGPTVNINFRQSDKNEWNFVGNLTQGLTNAEYFEVVAGITSNKTLSISSYPHYKGSYINVDKARNPTGLLRRMANLSYRNFMPWGSDDGGDIVALFKITLESGFPNEAVRVVLSSIKNLDQYVGQMRPDIDGTNAPEAK